MQLQKEIRYLIIIKVENNGEIFSSSNKEPVANLKLAKEIALKNLKVNFTLNESIVFITGYKYIYASVPINNIITGTHYEMQCIHSESLSEEEIKSI